MKSTYFISDLHLDSARPSTSRAFFRFLNDIADCGSLYILGDLFEAWPGDDEDSPLAVQVSDALAQFNAVRPRTYLLHGNRDFLLGEAFSLRSGSQILEEGCLIDLYGDQTLIMHGDSLCTDDTAYQTFRSMVRDPAWQSEVLALPLDERQGMARKFREKSHEAKSNKAEDIVDVSPTAVDAIMDSFEVERLIHGHTHRPGCFPTARGHRWVLGDWEHDPRILKVDSEEWKFLYIPI